MRYSSRRGAGTAPGALTQPASSPGPLAVVRLGANENPYGPAPSALRAIGAALPEANRYAFSAMSDTGAALAEHLRVPASHVVLGCGSSEILEAAVSAFTSRDRGLVTAAPTFELPAERAASTGAGVTDVRVDERGRLDLAAMLDRAPGSGLVYVCNPNNPTSTVHAATDIRAFIDNVHRRSPGTVVLVDEAYHEYVEAPAYASAAPLTVADAGLVVTRTFSKIYGLAGLRVGCAVGQPATLARLRPWLGDMTMSVLTAAAAGASLADAAHVERQRALNREARAFTLDALARRRVHRVRVRRQLRDGRRRPRLPFVRRCLCGARHPHRASVSAARAPRPHHDWHARRDAAGSGGLRRSARDAPGCDGAVAGSRVVRGCPGLLIGASDCAPTARTCGRLRRPRGRSSIVAPAAMSTADTPGIPPCRCSAAADTSPARSARPGRQAPPAFATAESRRRQAPLRRAGARYDGGP